MALVETPGLFGGMTKRQVRVEIDERNEKSGYMIREAQVVDRVPYMVIVGQKEAEEGTVSIRSRDTGETVTMTLDEFVTKIKDEIVTRKM